MHTNKQLVECVPNFSEGRDLAIIDQITAAIQTVEGVRLLNVDPGKATNRTVVTFVGEPSAVVEAAFRAIAKAGELIDMRNHKGEHPRMGATDVCPLIPIAGISLEETALYARQLAKRVGEELSIPVYCYEAAHRAPCPSAPRAGPTGARVRGSPRPGRGSAAASAPDAPCPGARGRLPARAA